MYSVKSAIQRTSSWSVVFYSGCVRRVEHKLKLEHVEEKPIDRSACCEEAIADSLECGGCVLFLHREFSPVCELRPEAGD